MSTPTTSLAALEAFLRTRLATGPLPGTAAQRRFAPQPEREGWEPHLIPESARPAATMLLLFDAGDGPAMPLTVRHADLPDHPGQVSLPGGAIDAGESPVAAALREAEEEIGIPSDHIRILGPLSSLWIDVSNFVVYPFVGIVDGPPEFRLHPREVAALLRVPLDEILNPHHVKWAHRERGGVHVDYSYFDLQNHVVWGATAMILSEFVDLFEKS